MGFPLTQKNNIYAEIGGAGYLGTINFERVFLQELIQELVMVPQKKESNDSFQDNLNFIL